MVQIDRVIGSRVEENRDVPADGVGLEESLEQL